MTGLILAWLTAEGIMCYRDVTANGRPPLPAELLSTSGLYVVLALLAEASAELAALLGWGFVLASLLNLWPGKTGSKTGAEAGQPLTRKAPAP